MTLQPLLFSLTLSFGIMAALPASNASGKTSAEATVKVSADQIYKHDTIYDIKRLSLSLDQAVDSD